MAKPICVCYYHPDEFHTGNGQVAEISKMNKMFEERFPDYNTIALPSYLSTDGSCEHIRFEVFNADNMDESSLNEFKEEILKTLLVT